MDYGFTTQITVVSPASRVPRPPRGQRRRCQPSRPSLPAGRQPGELGRPLGDGLGSGLGPCLPWNVAHAARLPGGGAPAAAAVARRRGRTLLKQVASRAAARVTRCACDKIPQRTRTTTRSRTRDRAGGRTACGGDSIAAMVSWGAQRRPQGSAGGEESPARGMDRRGERLAPCVAAGPPRRAPGRPPGPEDLHLASCARPGNSINPHRRRRQHAIHESASAGARRGGCAWPFLPPSVISVFTVQLTCDGRSLERRDFTIYTI